MKRDGHAGPLPWMLTLVSAAALALVAACGGAADESGAMPCTSRTCLLKHGYECRAMGGTHSHCVGKQEGYAMSAEFICREDSCVEKPFEGPVTPALLNNLDPNVFKIPADP